MTTLRETAVAPPGTGQRSTVAAQLRAAGCVYAEEEAEVLLSSARSPTQLRSMVEQRVVGRPLEHVVGWAEFCGQRYVVEAEVFVPRRRTEFLVQQGVLRASPGAVVVDLCCGCGAIGGAIASLLEEVELHAVDAQPAAVRCARQNLRGVGGGVYEGDLFRPLPAALRGRIHLLVVNAPYVPTTEVELLPREARLYEPRVTLDGGSDGLSIHRRVIAEAPRWLASGANLLFEATEQQALQLEEVLALHGLDPRTIRSDELETTAVVGRRPEA
jgi:release factor glutamine methyltransferase